MLELSWISLSVRFADEEAHVLAECFGEDLCFGLAWNLLHLIETAPSARIRQPEGAKRWRDGLANL
ncbi:hypothetical protein ACFU6I_41130 [Streptomyces sp. NPDC057486]|uniref:hypothetical protein n=1 Tax=Streptomyces sp. NPDC057486 TaxID=3346145 RepID=UPI0036766B40